MKIRWLGKYKTSEDKEPVPENYSLFIDKNKNILMISVIVVMLFIIAFASLKFKLAMTGIRFDRLGYYIGFAIAVLFVIVHELIHSRVKKATEERHIQS